MRLTWADTSASGRDSVLAVSTLSGVLSVPWDARATVREAPDSIDADKLPETVNLLQTGVEVTALAASSHWLAAGTSDGKVMLTPILRCDTKPCPGQDALSVTTLIHAVSVPAYWLKDRQGTSLYCSSARYLGRISSSAAD